VVREPPANVELHGIGGVVMFKIMDPTPEKVDAMAQCYLNDFPYLSDEDRNPTTVWLLMNKYFRVPGHYIYECGNGMLMFRDVIPGFKAHIVWIQFNHHSPTHKTFREAGDLMREFMEVFDLRKLEAETADWRVARLLERLGYEREGIRENSFMFRGQLLDYHLLALVRRNGGYHG
jgi:hypothetical protein